jgi:hypothetical protein
MINEVERIADQLRRAVEGEAWHGPALLELIEGMSADGSDEAAWSRLRTGLEDEYRALLSVVRALPEQALEAVVPGQNYSEYFLLHGVIQHTLYHAGQIAYARKLHSAGTDPSRSLLRHTVATLAYRAAKTVRGAPATFGDFKASNTSRTPRQILAHLGDLLDWAFVTAQGRPSWHDAPPLEWNSEIDRFFCSLQALQWYLASKNPLHVSAEKLVQGPIADALTHVGQIAMLRRISGSPIRGENYLLADIVAGRVGPDQAPPRREFD